ncbi:MAG: XF1762 family protein [Steroidobacteraceae bacterium]
MSLRRIHIELDEANEYVSANHRHHCPVRGHRFSIAAAQGFDLVGVAIVGRPVARALDSRTVIEVLRLCTDGTRNACSFLYGASARAGAALGYWRIGTYILASEPGTSLLAAGWTRGHTVKGRDWNCRSRGGRRTDQPMEDKTYWFKDLQ